MAHGMTILGLGTALPPHAVSQSEAATEASRLMRLTPEEQDTLATVYEMSGVKLRHSMLLQKSGAPVDQVLYRSRTHSDDLGPTTAERLEHYERLAPELAVRAAETALSRAGIERNDVTHLVTISCTGFSAPGVDLRLMELLGLPAGVSRTHLGFMGCHGALNGLRVARAYAESDPRAIVLLCAVELCSLHHDYGWSVDRLVANALFNDGAAALVGKAAEATDASWRVVANGSRIAHETARLMGWHIGDHGFEMKLSSRVPNAIAKYLRPWLNAWLESQDLSIEQVASWAVHPGGPRILNEVARSLELDLARLHCSSEVLEQCGNLSSPTVLFILDRLRSENAACPCVALAFGPGLTMEAALFR